MAIMELPYADQVNDLLIHPLRSESECARINQASNIENNKLVAIPPSIRPISNTKKFLKSVTDVAESLALRLGGHVSSVAGVEPKHSAINTYVW